MSYVLGIVGYFAMLFTLMGVNLIFGIKNNTSLDFGVHLIFYGLYYGVLGRDYVILYF
jgi:RING finger protein 121